MTRAWISRMGPPSMPVENRGEVRIACWGDVTPMLDQLRPGYGRTRAEVYYNLATAQLRGMQASGRLKADALQKPLIVNSWPQLERELAKYVGWLGANIEEVARYLIVWGLEDRRATGAPTAAAIAKMLASTSR